MNQCEACGRYTLRCEEYDGDQYARCTYCGWSPDDEERKAVAECTWCNETMYEGQGATSLLEYLFCSDNCAEQWIQKHPSEVRDALEEQVKLEG